MSHRVLAFPFVLLALLPTAVRAQVDTPLFPANAAIASPPMLRPLTEIGHVASRPCINDVELVGPLAYVIDTYYVHVVDVHDPLHPRVKRSSQRIPYADSVTRIGDVLYVSTLTTLELFDISRPGGLRHLRSLPLATLRVGEVHSRGSYAFVPADGNVVVLDTTVPSAPRAVTTLRVDTRDVAQLEGIAIDGDRMYIPLSDWAHSGLTTAVYEISDPVHPRLLGQILDGEYARSLVVQDGVAYWTVGDDVRIADVRDLSAIRPLARVPLGRTVSVVDVIGDRLFAGSEDVALIDISIPTSPRVLGDVDVRDSFRHVRVAGTTAYLAGHQAGGLYIVAMP